MAYMGLTAHPPTTQCHDPLMHPAAAGTTGLMQGNREILITIAHSMVITCEHGHHLD
jgi:hypothetical protein